MSRRHQRRVTMRHREYLMKNGSIFRWTEYPYGNYGEFRGYTSLFEAWKASVMEKRSFLEEIFLRAVEEACDAKE